MGKSVRQVDSTFFEEEQQPVVVDETFFVDDPIKKKDLSGKDSAIGTEDTSQSRLPLPSGSEPVTPFDWSKIKANKKQLPANIKRFNQDVAGLMQDVSIGATSPRQLQALYNNANTKDIVKELVKEYDPEAEDHELDGVSFIAPNSFRDDSRWKDIAKKINTTNRVNALDAEDQSISGLDERIKKTLSDYQASYRSEGFGPGATVTRQYNQKLPEIDVNSPAQIQSLINEIEGSSYFVGADGKPDYKAKQNALDDLKGKMFFLKTNEQLDSKIIELTDKIGNAVTRTNLSRERGEAVKPEDYAKDDFLNKEHFKLGLNYIKDVSPAKYRNIIRSLEGDEKVADSDFRQLADIGQEIRNRQVFRGGADNPDLIDAETDLDYATYQDKKAQYAGVIGEWLKDKGYTNVRQYSPELIKAAAKANNLDNPEIVNDLSWEEGLLGYDAIPKSGWTEAIARGVAQPFEGIKNTFDNLSDDASGNYLRSQQFDVGSGQKVANKKGQLSNELASDRGNIWYDALEGLGQFIPQILLTKGIGGATAGVLGADARLALSAAQKANISTYGGTFISTYLQEYGHAYEDGLNKTGDPRTAKAMGAINGIAAASFELFLPDTKIADRASKLFNRKYATDIIDLIKKGGNPEDLLRQGRPLVEKFVKETAEITKQEVKEEVATQLVNYITESIFSPETAKNRELDKELFETAKATAVSMILPAVFGGGGAALSKDFTVNGLHSAAINFEGYKSALNKALTEGTLTQDEHDAGIKMLSTHRQSIATSPLESSSGKKLSKSERLEYAYQETLLKKYNEDLKNTASEVAKEDIQEKIDKAQDIQRQILGRPKPEVKEGEKPVNADDEWKNRVVSVEEENKEISPDEISPTVELDPNLPEGYKPKEVTPEDIVIKKAANDELGAYSKMVRDNPAMATEVLKDVAQQVYGITSTGEPLTGGSREGALSLQMGQDVVDAAKQKYPTPEYTLQSIEEDLKPLILDDEDEIGMKIDIPSIVEWTRNNISHTPKKELYTMDIDDLMSRYPNSEYVKGPTPEKVEKLRQKGITSPIIVQVSNGEISASYIDAPDLLAAKELGAKRIPVVVWNRSKGALDAANVAGLKKLNIPNQEGQEETIEDITDRSETGKPIDFEAYRVSENEDIKPETGAFFSDSKFIDVLIDRSKKEEQYYKGLFKGEKKKYKVGLKNPIKIKNKQTFLSEMVKTSDNETRVAAQNALDRLKKDKLSAHGEVDKLIAKEAKKRGHDGIINEDESEVIAFNKTSFKKLNETEQLQQPDSKTDTEVNEQEKTKVDKKSLSEKLKTILGGDKDQDKKADNSAESGPIVNEKEAKKLLKYLSKKFGIEGILVDLGFNGNRGQFIRKKARVEINRSSTLNEKGEYTAATETTGNLNRRTIFHEYIHPFVEVLKSKNRELYDSILGKAKEENEKENFADIDHYHPSERDEELLVRYMDRISDMDNPPSLLKQFFDWLSGLFYNNREDKKSDLKKLSKDTTVEELYDVFKGYGNLKEDYFDSQNKTPVEQLKTELEAYEKMLDGNTLTNEEKEYVRNEMIPNINEEIRRIESVAQSTDGRGEKINDFVKSAIAEGASREDIKSALMDNGLSEQEAEDFIQNNKKPRIRVVVGNDTPQTEEEKKQAAIEKAKQEIKDRKKGALNLRKVLKDIDVYSRAGLDKSQVEEIFKTQDSLTPEVQELIDNLYGKLEQKEGTKQNQQAKENKKIEEGKKILDEIFSKISKGQRVPKTFVRLTTSEAADLIQYLQGKYEVYKSISLDQLEQVADDIIDFFGLDGAREMIASLDISQKPIAMAKVAMRLREDGRELEAAKVMADLIQTGTATGQAIKSFDRVKDIIGSIKDPTFRTEFQKAMYERIQTARNAAEAEFNLQSDVFKQKISDLEKQLHEKTISENKSLLSKLVDKICNIRGRK